jgi:flagellar protein FliO/FliZ
MFDPIPRLQKWYKDSSPKQKLTAVLVLVSLLATGIFVWLSSGADASSDPLASTPLYLVGVLIKFIGVLLLIVVSALLYRRWMYLGPQSGAARQLRLLETVRLSPKQVLYLVAVGDQQLLIGATDQNISLLSQLEGSFASTPAEGTQTQQGLDFGALVQSFNSNLPTAPHNGKE